MCRRAARRCARPCAIPLWRRSPAGKKPGRRDPPPRAGPRDRAVSAGTKKGDRAVPVLLCHWPERLLPWQWSCGASGLPLRRPHPCRAATFQSAVPARSFCLRVSADRVSIRCLPLRRFPARQSAREILSRVVLPAELPLSLHAHRAASREIAERKACYSSCSFRFQGRKNAMRSASLIVGATVGLLFLSGCLTPTHSSHQTMLHQMGSQVMPFDLSKTQHEAMRFSAQLSDHGADATYR